MNSIITKFGIKMIFIRKIHFLSLFNMIMLFCIESTLDSVEYDWLAVKLNLKVNPY